LLGVKRTLSEPAPMSAFDPKRTLAASIYARDSSRRATHGALVAARSVSDSAIAALPSLIGQVAQLFPSSPLGGGSDVDLPQFAGRPFYGFFCRHALHCFGVHVDDHVLAQHLAGFAIGRTGIAWELSRAAGFLERQHDRILLPQRILFPNRGRA